MTTKFRFFQRMGILLALTCMGIVFAAPGIPVNQAQTSPQLITPQVAAEYTPHAAIVINNEAAWATAGFPGSGNVTNPYIIAGYSIASDNSQGYCIRIQSSTKCVVISNCYLILNDSVTMTMGVQIYDSANITITNNIFFANNSDVYGTFISNTIDVIVNGNQFLNFPRIGVDCGINAYGDNTRLCITNNYIPKAWIGINSGSVGASDTTNNLTIASNYVGYCMYGIQVFWVNTGNISYNLLKKSQKNFRDDNCLNLLMVNNTYIEMPIASFTLWPVTAIIHYVEDVLYFIGDVVNGSAPITYEWDFGDSAGITVTTGASASHKFSVAGIYDVTLTVIDGDGDSSVYSKQVTVSSTIDGFPIGMLLCAGGIGVILLGWRKSRMKNPVNL